MTADLEPFDQGMLAGARSAWAELEKLDGVNVGLVMAHYGTHARLCRLLAKDPKVTPWRQGCLLGRATAVDSYIERRRAGK